MLRFNLENRNRPKTLGLAVLFMKTSTATAPQPQPQPQVKTATAFRALLEIIKENSNAKRFSVSHEIFLNFWIELNTKNLIKQIHTVFRVRRVTFFLVYRVEQQKLNQMIAEFSFYSVFLFNPTFGRRMHLLVPIASLSSSSSSPEYLRAHHHQNYAFRRL